MEKRMNPYEKGSREGIRAMHALGIYLQKSTIEQSLLHLVFFRVSQINGCAYCLDMHAKDLRLAGESEQRLYVLDAWRDAPFYSQRERAALAWAEAVTRLEGGQVPARQYAAARGEFSEAELVDLTLGVITINSYNRLNIAFAIEGGSYQPAKQALQNV